MSVTLSAIPFILLASAIAAVVPQGTAIVDALAQEQDGDIGQELHVKKEYQTAFVDKDLLTKTLIEHGVEELTFVGDYIICKVGGYVLRFSKEDENPYMLEIMASAQSIIDCDSTIDEVASEYGQNVQEATYYKIKERLSQNNMQIDNEEILEDNSIVLTVNLN